MLRKLEEDAKEELVPEKMVEKEVALQTYKNFVRPGGRTQHPKPRDAVLEILCPPNLELDHHNWSCVLRRCLNCPSFPVPEVESMTGHDAPVINFHHYVPFTKCSKHGSLTLRAKECERCENTQEGGKKGKIQTRKELTLLCRPIGVFIADFYLVALEKYAYHSPHVKILSKQETQCGSTRMKAFLSRPGSIKTIRDYAERLLATFNLEIQSSHFGNGRSLSMEGSTVQFFPASELEKYRQGVEEIIVSMESHSHFSDDSRQDASTTYEHVNRLFKELFQRKILTRGSVVFTDTDGCCKQYRCGTSIYLNSLLSSEHGVVIDQAIGAPGHGKRCRRWHKRYR
jgi:hypothetical protein